jgi:hypothetical protein
MYKSRLVARARSGLSLGPVIGTRMVGKLVVKVRVLSGEKCVHALGMLFDAEASVRSVLTRAALATCGCNSYGVVCFPSDAAAMEGKGGFHLDDEDLDTLTVLQLRDNLGLNIVVHEHTTVKVPDTEWIELCVAEAVVAEALLLGEQQVTVEAAARHAADARACRLERDLERMANTLLRAQTSADLRAAEFQEAERLVACEKAARQAMEQMLRAEAAAADAAECAASAAWALMRAHEYDQARGGRGG